MSSHLKDRIQKIQEIIAKLVEASVKGTPIVVEGKKDAQALRELGVTGTVVTVKTGGKSYLESTAELEALGKCEVILLLDFDRRGREGTKRLTRNLESLRIGVNAWFWRELHGLVGKDIQCIESLPSYLTAAQQKLQ